MNEKLRSDLDQIDSILKLTVTRSLDFLSTLSTRPTSLSDVGKESENQLPQEGLGALMALDIFQRSFDPILVASTGPRYWGYVTGGATPASLMGDWLAAVYDQNTQSMKGEGDISARIEEETIRLLLQLFRLPNEFLGGFVTGATLSNFTSLAVARQWLGNALGKDIANDGMCEGLQILTASPHSSAIKSLSMLGMGRSLIQKIDLKAGNREAMDINDLKKKAKSLNGQPFLLIASVGTVNTCDFDDLKAIAELKKEFHFWWHIDAAFGGFAACSPTTRHLVEGWELADSITIDCHKWLNVPYESAFFLIRNEHRHLQVETFKNSSAPYLGDPLDNFNYLNFLPENSRRLRALPAWFTLMAYGEKGYQEIVENCICLSQKLGAYLEASDHFELLAPVRLNTVCFRPLNADSSEFLKRVNASGKVFLTPTQLQGKSAIRAALVNWRTTEEDVEIAISELEKALRNP